MAFFIAENLISLAIGMGTILVSSLSVAGVLRYLPRPNAWACLGLASAATSIALIVGGMLMIAT